MLKKYRDWRYRRNLKRLRKAAEQLEYYRVRWQIEEICDRLEKEDKEGGPHD